MSVCLAVLIFLAYLVFIKCIYRRHRRTFLESLKHVLNASTCREAGGADIRVLIVTAHPDDECMFFAPTIIQLVELHASVHLLCLSQGNYYNKGAQRKQELLNSCAVLGIPDSRITIVNQKGFLSSFSFTQNPHIHAPFYTHVLYILFILYVLKLIFSNKLFTDKLLQMN
uniref:N-acetylglucosaminylphosphatidylinositol deacetylase n=1 Tax=Mola mola TaxID=94237 RepID=A0A3Q4AMF7_MOLML